MSDPSLSATSFELDDEAASKADNVANRIDQSAAYIGRFKTVHSIKAERTGTSGLHFEFVSPGGGQAGFDVYTVKADGTKTFGWNQVMALMALLGLRSLRGVKGKHEAFVDGKRQEVEGEVFPDFADKDIGLVLQKERYNKQDGGETFRMNLQALFHPVTKMTSSEIKERKATPEKLEKILRSLKDKDSRKVQAAEPGQPAVGAPEGSY